MLSQQSVGHGLSRWQDSLQDLSPLEPGDTEKKKYGSSKW